MDEPTRGPWTSTATLWSYRLTYIAGLSDFLVQNQAGWTAGSRGPFFGASLPVDATLGADWRLAAQRFQSVLMPAPAPDVTFPDPVDWRARDGADWMDPVGYQGPTGACVAFALAPVIAATARRVVAQDAALAGTPVPALSVADLLFQAGGNVWLGIDPDRALASACEHGVQAESDWPFLFYGTGPISKGPVTQVRQWARSRDPRAARLWLRDRGPVFTFFQPGTDFLAYESGTYRPCEDAAYSIPYQFHAACVIGFDEQRGAWLCRNSWGPDWGEGGHFWWPFDGEGFDEFWGVDRFSRISNVPVQASAAG